MIVQMALILKYEEQQQCSLCTHTYIQERTTANDWGSLDSPIIFYRAATWGMLNKIDIMYCILIKNFHQTST